MKSFAELFKSYRLRAEFNTFSDFSNALAEKGYFYEESIFSRWQKGTRVPTERKLLLSIIEIFIERHAIKTDNEINELLAAAGFGYLTEAERKNFDATVKEESKIPIKRKAFIKIILFTSLSVVVLFLSIFFFFNTQKNYITTSAPVASAVTEPKKLVIGTDATLVPMEYIDNGKLVGFDVDLGMHLAKELDADIEFRTITFDNLFNSLDQRQINMIISAVTIIDERKEKYDFSEPYLNAGQVIITKKENQTIQNPDDLKGKKIATQTGTTNEKEALKYTSDKYVIRYADFVQATQALSEGKVDALFTDLPNAKGIIAKNPSLKIVDKPFTNEYYGIVFIKGDPSVTQINEAIDSLRKKGVLTELEKKWLYQK